MRYPLLFIIVLLSIKCNSPKVKDFSMNSNSNKNDYKSEYFITDKIILKNEFDSIIDYNSVFNQNKKLVFIYESINCNTCIETILNYLNIKNPQIKKSLVVISNYSNPRDLFVFKRVNNFEGMVLNDINLSIINLFKEKLPILCVIENNKLLKVIFADAHNINTVKQYLISVKHDFK